MNVTGLSKTKIYDLQTRGDFPMRVELTAHAIAWVEEDVQAWLASRVARGRLRSVEPLLTPLRVTSRQKR
jgi:predicted DNA-binding transcriptional regulator AlpA